MIREIISFDPAFILAKTNVTGFERVLTDDGRNYLERVAQSGQEHLGADMKLCVKISDRTDFPFCSLEKLEHQIINKVAVITSGRRRGA
ncbi:hypothetical protein [Sporolactobacillus shoreae]|uniref:hypothetical protein n=1 Tax=Sporolactobacillus shoreae TaxID=1465501 RepID=UPI0014330392|nr:hypothetical protein [Sporolactobacillus shoreae]